MSITKASQLIGMKKVSEVVGRTLFLMRSYAEPGMTTKTLDEFGGEILRSYGARPAPNLAYGFPGWTCISINGEIAHGIPSDKKVLGEGDLVNIDVSAELDGFWSDNGGSFVLGRDINRYQPLVDTSRRILLKAIDRIRGGVKIAAIGHMIETEAGKAGYQVIRNLGGHGVGRNLHEAPKNIPNYRDSSNTQRFKKNTVVAVETFISTHSDLAVEREDGWTLVGNRGGLTTQHEHTIVVTDKQPIILTKANRL